MVRALLRATSARTAGRFAPRARLAAQQIFLAPRSRALCAQPDAETVSMTFIEDGEEVQVSAEIGKSLLEVAHANEIDLEGACDGSLACSTCHLILDQEVYDALPAPDEEEEDMLDLAMDLTDTSRLGCQIKVTKDLEGMVARVPSGF